MSFLSLIGSLFHLHRKLREHTWQNPATQTCQPSCNPNPEQSVISLQVDHMCQSVLHPAVLSGTKRAHRVTRWLNITERNTSGIHVHLRVLQCKQRGQCLDDTGGHILARQNQN